MWKGPRFVTNPERSITQLKSTSMLQLFLASFRSLFGGFMAHNLTVLVVFDIRQQWLILCTLSAQRQTADSISD